MKLLFKYSYTLLKIQQEEKRNARAKRAYKITQNLYLSIASMNIW